MIRLGHPLGGRRPRAGHLWPTLTIASIVLANSILLTGTPAAALAGPYCGTKSNWFDGYRNAVNDSHWWEGTSGTIVVRKGLVCDADSSSNNFSTAWVMISNQNGSLQPGWVQSGYYRWWGSSIYHFAQYKRDKNTGFVTKIATNLGALSPGSSYLYWEQWVPSTGHERALIGTVVLLETNFNPIAYWTEPFQVSWSGETAYRESDVPGTSSGKARFATMNVQRYSDDTWTNALPTLYGIVSTSRWAQSAVSGAAFDIWTK